MNVFDVVEVGAAVTLFVDGDNFDHLRSAEVLTVGSDGYLVTACLVRHDDVENSLCDVRNVDRLSLSCLEHDAVSFLMNFYMASTPGLEPGHQE